MGLLFTQARSPSWTPCQVPELGSSLPIASKLRLAAGTERPDKVVSRQPPPGRKSIGNPGPPGYGALNERGMVRKMPCMSVWDLSPLAER